MPRARLPAEPSPLAVAIDALVGAVPKTECLASEFACDCCGGSRAAADLICAFLDSGGAEAADAFARHRGAAALATGIGGAHEAVACDCLRVLTAWLAAAGAAPAAGAAAPAAPAAAAAAEALPAAAQPPPAQAAAQLAAGVPALAQQHWSGSVRAAALTELAQWLQRGLAPPPWPPPPPPGAQCRPPGAGGPWLAPALAGLSARASAAESLSACRLVAAALAALPSGSADLGRAEREVAAHEALLRAAALAAAAAPAPPPEPPPPPSALGRWLDLVGCLAAAGGCCAALLRRTGAAEALWCATREALEEGARDPGAAARTEQLLDAALLLLLPPLASPAELAEGGGGGTPGPLADAHARALELGERLLALPGGHDVPRCAACELLAASALGPGGAGDGCREHAARCLRALEAAARAALGALQGGGPPRDADAGQRRQARSALLAWQRIGEASGSASAGAALALEWRGGAARRAPLLRGLAAAPRAGAAVRALAGRLLAEPA